MLHKELIHYSAVFKSCIHTQSSKRVNALNTVLFEADFEVIKEAPEKKKKTSKLASSEIIESSVRSLWAVWFVCLGTMCSYLKPKLKWKLQMQGLIFFVMNDLLGKFQDHLRSELSQGSNVFSKLEQFIHKNLKSLFLLRASCWILGYIRASCAAPHVWHHVALLGISASALMASN